MHTLQSSQGGGGDIAGIGMFSLAHMAWEGPKEA